MFGELAPLFGLQPNISYLSLCGVSPYNAMVGPSSALWPAANLAIFHPIRLAVPVTVTKFWLINGATAAGNVDIGIYDLNGYRIASTGSTAQGTVSVLQSIDVTDFTIGPGGFYLAMALDNGTATSLSNSMTAIQTRELGLAEMAAAFPLPATATLAVVSTAAIRLHLFGLSRRVTV